MSSDGRAGLRSGDDAETVRVADPRDETAAEAPAGDEAAVPAEAVSAPDAEETASGQPDEDSVHEVGDQDPVDEDPVDEHPVDEVEDDDGGGRRNRASLSVPLVPVLAVLFVLLLGGTAFLWFTRPSPSSVRTADYAQVLEAARSEVVDLTSFDYLTLDDDIAQIKKIAVGDLQKESVDQLNSKRQDLTTQQAVVNTQIVGAAVTRADSSNGTVLLVIQSTQKTKASSQPTVVRYRIQAELEKQGGRWLLSGISGR